jgi:positive regulator of sigma E activity
MLLLHFIRATYVILLYILLGLAVIALVAELIPEMESKIIVIPTLLLMITVSVLGLGLWKMKVNSQT